VNVKILVCQIIGPAASGFTGPVPTPVLNETFLFFWTANRLNESLHKRGGTVMANKYVRS